MSRPADLPDFRNPPLNEVAIGVQFGPPRGYSQIRAGEVWALFKSEFPLVEEHPPLPPAFETFGLPLVQQMRLGFVTGAAHDRFWFLTKPKDELIQFQQDRLLHNWRKIGDEANEYPRFERMIEKFKAELIRLEQYVGQLSPQALAINQCELTYINLIPCAADASCQPGQWLKILNFGTSDAEDFTVVFRRVIHDRTGAPLGRLVCEATVALVSGRRMIQLALAARGAPVHSDIPAALDFLVRGREIVVRTFAEITTDSAHLAWQRFQ